MLQPNPNPDRSLSRTTEVLLDKRVVRTRVPTAVYFVGSERHFKASSLKCFAVCFVGGGNRKLNESEERMRSPAKKTPRCTDAHFGTRLGGLTPPTELKFFREGSSPWAGAVEEYLFYRSA